jgi:hypothetical protein
MEVKWSDSRPVHLNPGEIIYSTQIMSKIGWLREDKVSLLGWEMSDPSVALPLASSEN